MVTVSALCREIEQLLQAGGCDSPAFDACCLLEDIGGIGRGSVPLCGEKVLSDEQVARVRRAATRRAAGEPLQYILGTWDFLTLTLEVGEGVLIPRPETEQLCELAAQRLRGIPHPRVLDLCAGSGCVGLGVASLCPTAAVTAVEKSAAAFDYLQRNTARYPALSVTAVRGDVLTDAKRFTEPVHAIVSNPPYIPAADLPTLQREVQHEPSMALDGGTDGLTFYRAIAREWVPLLYDGGFVLVEIGVGQAEEVCRLFREAGLTQCEALSEFAGNPRVICGGKEYTFAYSDEYSCFY